MNACVCGHVSESCRAHIKHLKDSCEQQDQIPLCTSRCLEITAVRPAECPPGLAYFSCSHCKTWFTTQKTAKAHLKRANDNAVKIKENKAKTLKKHGRKLAECAGATVSDELLLALTAITTNGTAVVDDTMRQRLSEERLSEERLSEERLSGEPLLEERLSEEPLLEERLWEERLSEEPLSEEPLSEEESAFPKIIVEI
jgi:hypothetical protein